MNALKNLALTGLVGLIARLWLGYEWLHGCIEKVFSEGNVAWFNNEASAGVTGFLKGTIAKSPLAVVFEPSDMFLPNAQIITYLVAYGELLVGIALIVGIFTRFSASTGGMMAPAFLLVGSTSSSLPVLLMIALAMTLNGKTSVSTAWVFARSVEIKSSPSGHT